MRLRSSQFVFLLLLVCSVQITDEYALKLMAATVSSRPADAQQRREIASVATMQRQALAIQTPLAAEPTRLDAAAFAAHRTPWMMRRPALAATAVASHTSLFRA